jgi:hypothetical protein
MRTIRRKQDHLMICISDDLFTPGCFEALGIRIKAGRDLLWVDWDGSKKLCLVNEYLVEDSGSSPPGKLLLFFSPTLFSWQKVEEKNVGEKNKNCPGRRQTLEVFQQAALTR